MATVKFPPSPLPLNPAPYDEWREHRPGYLSVYDIMLNAERYANEQVEAGLSNREAKDNVMFARVAGYLLIELFNRRAALESEEPCAKLARDVESGSQAGGTAHDVVYEVGKRYYNSFLLLCTFGFSPTPFAVSVSLQIGHPPRDTQHPHHSLRVPPSTRWNR